MAGSAARSGPARVLPLDDAYAAMQNKFWGAYSIGLFSNIRDSGALTFVPGVYSVSPSAGAVLQGATNAAIEAMARGLALELVPRVRVNTVSPRTTDTPLWNGLSESGRLEKMNTMRARLSLGFIARPSDIAEAISYMSTNRFATGSTVLVDGGDALV